MSDNDAPGGQSERGEDGSESSTPDGTTSEAGRGDGDDSDGSAADGSASFTDDSGTETAPRSGSPSTADWSEFTDTEATESTIAPRPETEPGDTPTDAVDPGSIDPEALTIPVQTLHPRVRIVWIVGAMVTSAIVGGLLGAAAWFFEFTYLVPLGVATVLLAVGVVHSLLRYRVWRYEVREDALYLERGVFTRVRTVVPFVRIQHVDTSRSPTERLTGLATSVVYTAGSRGADVTIPGLEPDRAEDLQHRLKQLAIAAEDDTAV